MADDVREEVERRTGKDFASVREDLTEYFSQDWEEVEVFIATAADKKGRSEADVIVDLVGKLEEPPPGGSKIRRAMIRWIGKPWRERENPWDRYKHRVPGKPPSTDLDDEDLEEWTPLKPEEDED